MTDDEILKETFRRINHLIAQEELYEAYLLARIWDILLDLWEWTETLENAKTIINDSISAGDLREAYELAHWWGIQERWRWLKILSDNLEPRGDEEGRSELEEQN